MRPHRARAVPTPTTRSSAQGLEWAQAPFYSPIESPAVVTQVQTHTGGDWTKTRQQAVTNDGFQVKLEEQTLAHLHQPHKVDRCAAGQPYCAGIEESIAATYVLN
jgi:hypothetical protein